jgi:hypothetical protein
VLTYSRVILDLHLLFVLFPSSSSPFSYIDSIPNYRGKQWQLQ